MSNAPVGVTLDAEGFNELRFTRTGPMLYNKFDIYVGGSLRKYGEFSVGEQQLFRAVVQPGSVVVEVGANIGGHTVELARLTGPTGEVHAFEPQRIVFQALCANLALNQLTNVYGHQAAVGAERAVIAVPAMDPRVRSNFGGVSMFNVQAGEPVPMVTIDSVDLPACHFLKVDVEGMEVDVLKGARKTIEAYGPVMYLENDRRERSEQLLRLVEELGYKAYWHLPRLFNPDNFARDGEDIFPNIVSVNVLCLPTSEPPRLSGLRPVTSVTDWWR